MPLTDLARIEAQTRAPIIVRLWWALQRLRTPASFMNTGAHPDDETSGMLAALGFRDGFDISYTCATRGEGGQNDIGTETAEALGVLRTAEMERAAEVLGLRLYWLSQGPDDTIFDFGFSKSGEETLGKWGRERALQRFVDIVRTERPDILCPTFLDVPGQHGHHQAMTQLAHEVFEVAADPAFASDHPPWAPAKLYLPAWSGAGQAYDDDLPPPPATLTVAGKGRDPVTGWSYAQIGEQSRAFHRTQAMGRWIAPGAERDFPLHLAASRTGMPDDGLLNGLPASLPELDVPQIASILRAAQDQMDTARAEFPNMQKVLAHASAALIAIRAAVGACPEPAARRVMHRLARKAAQLSTVIRLASGAQVHGRLSDDTLRPGQTTELEIEMGRGAADCIAVRQILPPGWRRDGGHVTLGGHAEVTDPYPQTWLPDAPRAPSLAVTIEAGGIASETSIPPERAPIVAPAASADLRPLAMIVNRQTTGRDIDLTLRDVFPRGATPAIRAPEGWRVAPTSTGFRVSAPAEPQTGEVALTLTLDGDETSSVRAVNHPHIDPRALIRPARVRVRVIDAALPEVRVGYVGGGQDRVAHWLRAMGLTTVELTDADLSSDAALGTFGAIVIGIFALKFRPALAAEMPRLHRWTRAGGTLVSLYHRPWDNWIPDAAPPRRIEIGQPSLRWRVTDEAARVEHLIPDHPLLTTPNPIGPEDWQGWHKERGLYFARSWDKAYQPLLRMGDPGESLDGGLLAADIGRGRHVHTSLILHHQMEHLVPGAFRLMANLLAPRD